ncbi:MAG: hypothetical protein PHD76_00510 [Methylacidiphilales bacterium]|nr:hypothetical protein [Candidatus Methylacidiphilales bacterium]
MEPPKLKLLGLPRWFTLLLGLLVVFATWAATIHYASEAVTYIGKSLALAISDKEHICLTGIFFIIGTVAVILFSRSAYRSGDNVGFKRGQAAGSTTGHEEGIKSGITLGIQQEQKLRQFPHYEPLRLAFSELANKLATGQLSTDFQKIISGYAAVIYAWNKLVVEADSKQNNLIEELHLAAQVLQNYLRQLPEQINPSSRRLLLPANFEVYAECVKSILEIVTACNPRHPGTIRVWTHLCKPIRRWYNLSESVSSRNDGTLFVYAHSYPWWEEYKQSVQKLRLKDKRDQKKIIQMRRIVSCGDNGETKREFLYNINNSAVLTVNDAAKISFNGRCPKLLSEVNEAIRLKAAHATYPLYLIGKCNCAHQHHYPQWVSLGEHFNDEYHDAVIPQSGFVCGSETKGVYCVYDDQPADQYEYEDVFLVNMEPVGGSLFGIAFYRDKVNNLSGIVFLTDEEINKEMKELQDIWDRAERTPA